MKPKLIYLAVPYTHPNPDVQQLRFEQVTAVAADIMKAGHYVFSPVTHCHPIAKLGTLPTDWTFWKGFDVRMLTLCDELVVLCLPGWQESRGIWEERQLATTLNIPISFRDV